MLNDRPAAGITVSAVPYESSLEKDRREARRGPVPEAIAKAITNSKGEEGVWSEGLPRQWEGLRCYPFSAALYISGAP
jgi:hypothetical protein